MAEKSLSLAQKIAAAAAGKDSSTDEAVTVAKGESLKTKSGSGN